MCLLIDCLRQAHDIAGACDKSHKTKDKGVGFGVKQM